MFAFIRRRASEPARSRDWVAEVMERFDAQVEHALPPTEATLLEGHRADQTHRVAFNARIRQTIDEALLRKGLSARAASVAVVGHDGLIRDIRRGNVPTADKLAALAKLLGLEFYFGSQRAPQAGGNTAATEISGQLRQLVRAAMERDGVGARTFEEQRGLPKWSLRGFLDPAREQAPSIDRAQEICAALGLEIHICPRPRGRS